MHKLWKSFTHPHVVPSLYEFDLVQNTKEDILNNIGESNSQWSLLNSIVFFHNMEVNGVHSLRNIIFLFLMADS